MILLLISFVAGLLTVLSPCVLPLLPVIIGGAATDVRSRFKPFIITASLAVSVVLFTLLLKVATVFIDVPPYIWQWLSGLILITFGLITLFPDIWERWSYKWNLVISRKSNTLLSEGVKRESISGDVIIGAALGPVFTSCSPTYFVILATVLPASFGMGLIDLVAYAVGLSLSLLLIALIGQRLVANLAGASLPHGWFKRSLGALFLLVGILVITGTSAKIESYLIRNSVFDITKVETKILKNLTSSGADATSFKGGTSENSLLYPKYNEIVNPAGFVNSEPFELADLVGKKVILLDMMTYSCINCQRTFPYLRAWYSKYKDQGLEIVAIHTPEFAFEKKKGNVEAAFKQFGLTFPAVLDNDYATWNAYGNNYWPHKYLIDIDGYIRYDHIGEGAYEETEAVIKELLKERAEKFKTQVDVAGSASKTIEESVTEARSVETYFGAHRNSEFFGNGSGGRVYVDNFNLPLKFTFNQFFLGGGWKIEKEYMESEGESVVAFPYSSKMVYLVAESLNGSRIQVQNKVQGEENMVNVSSIDIGAATLYTIINNKERKSGTLMIKADKGVRMYALTFG